MKEQFLQRMKEYLQEDYEAYVKTLEEDAYRGLRVNTTKISVEACLLYTSFDIDGTLTNRATGEIVPSALATLKKLEAAGHFVSIATGRAHYKARGLSLIHI